MASETLTALRLFIALQRRKSSTSNRKSISRYLSADLHAFRRSRQWFSFVSELVLVEAVGEVRMESERLRAGNMNRSILTDVLFAA